MLHDIFKSWVLAAKRESIKMLTRRNPTKRIHRKRWKPGKVFETLFREWVKKQYLRNQPLVL